MATGYGNVQLCAPRCRRRMGAGREACCYSSAITTSKIIVHINKASKQTSGQTRTRLGEAGKGRTHQARGSGVVRGSFRWWGPVAGTAI